MVNELVRAATSWTDRWDGVPPWAAVVVVVAAVVVGVHGTVYAFHAPVGHPEVTVGGVLAALWALTTIVAFGGLAALAGAYASLARTRETGRQVDLGILPDAERRILDSVLESPSITQVEVVDRSGFSDAKVSQTLSALRERGLVYREPQGRTYRLYPGRRFDGGGAER